MKTLDLIIKKRSGDILTDQEITFLITEYVKGNIPDYQMSAFLMAIYFQGMTEHESTALALAMRDSGDKYDLDLISGIKVDKHSTGGVGDKVTLVLGPMIASLGAKFAKMSGRGLGHTGGTIDKLEAIPNFQIEQDYQTFTKQVESIGIAIIGQSENITPADKKLYSLRDVTGTVDSIPLIASSIMSKKLASGADAIVLDVKVGSGAFMTNLLEAEKLANLMVKIGRLAGKKMTAIITNMDEPLGHKIGNSLEIYESIETLKGNGPSDLVEVCVEIGAHLLIDAKLYDNFEEAKKALVGTLTDQSAFNKFKELVIAQGGDISVVENPELLIQAPTYKLLARKSGYLEKIITSEVGVAARVLGAGRLTKEDKLDLEVGIDLHKKIGDKISKGDLIATIYHHDKGLEEAILTLEKALIIGKNKKEVRLIEKTIK